MKKLLTLLLGLTSALCMPLHANTGPSAAEFAWRATLTLPQGASVARVQLPADAMSRLQSADARDVRVFNVAGEPVAFALTPTANALSSPPHQATRTYPAYPLFSSSPGQPAAKGSVAVGWEQVDQARAIWVQLSEQSDNTSATRLPSVLFDTRSEKQNITALTLTATLPANTLLPFTLASSSDLVQWTPVPVKGPVFRFEGEGAPVNPTLELTHALPLQGRYLRLSWPAQSEVQVQGFAGRIAPSTAPPAHLRMPLGSGQTDGSSYMEWALAFATPIAALHLESNRDNTLVPIRVLGRNDAAQPWHPLAQGVVFRRGDAESAQVNPALGLGLGAVSVRQLRVEALLGMPLPTQGLRATVEFKPVELVFLASGSGPFELAVGRAQTIPAAVDATLLTQVVQGPLEALPLAQISQAHMAPDASSTAALQRVLPTGVEPRKLVLWVVLLAGVLLLAGVAWALMRQLAAKTGPDVQPSDRP